MSKIFLYNLVLNSLVICFQNTSKSFDNKTDYFVSIQDKTPINFKEIIDMNKQIQPLQDICTFRIFGGVKGDLKLVPYQISLVRQFYTVYASFCGGSLITMAHILSAAHCFTDPRTPHFSELYAIAGSTLSHHMAVETAMMRDKGDVQYRQLKDVYIHSKFKETTLRNDVAILEVNEHFVKSHKVQPIRLHSDRKQTSLNDGTRCLASGYGKVSEVEWSNKFMMTCLPLINRKICENVYSDVYLTQSNFCAGEEGKNTCLGDSGGPLACHGILVGISSFGLNCSIDPAVYTKVLSFVEETIGVPENLEPLQKSLHKKREQSVRNADESQWTLKKLGVLLVIVCAFF